METLRFSNRYDKFKNKPKELTLTYISCYIRQNDINYNLFRKANMLQNNSCVSLPDPDKSYLLLWFMDTEGNYYPHIIEDTIDDNLYYYTRVNQKFKVRYNDKKLFW